MDAYSTPSEYPRKTQRLLQAEPWMIYFTVCILGAGCSSVFPAITTQVEQMGFVGISKALPHLYAPRWPRVYLAAIVISTYLFACFKHQCYTVVHLGFGVLFSVLGLFTIGLSEQYEDKSKYFGFLLGGRVYQGLGYGYLLSFCTIDWPS